MVALTFNWTQVKKVNSFGHGAEISLMPGRIFEGLLARVCGGISMNFLTHTIHAHTNNYICPQHYFSTYVYCLRRPLACCRIESRHTLTLLCSCQFTRNSASMFIGMRCMDNKISWLGQCRQPHHPPPPLRPLHPQVIQKAYPSSGVSRDTVRNVRW
jgi:hypothetical protein